LLTNDNAITTVMNSPGFTRSKTCYYNINAPLTAKDGDLLYFKMINSASVSVVVSMAVDMNDFTPKVSCNVTAGSVVIARHP
jgi:hypothetical protein